MGFRITTNMTLNSYRYNLQNSTRKLTEARDMVLTGRYFNNYAEDPAGATLAFRLRRSWYQTNSHLANTKDVYSKYDTAYQNLMGAVHDLSDATARVASIRGNNGATGEARRALAIDLRETAESVIQAFNQKLGDHFIFAGNDALNVPFSWENGKLLYRGVDVLGGWVDRPTSYSPPDWVKLNPETGTFLTRPGDVPASSGDPWEQAWIDYYNDQYYREMKAVPCPADRPAWIDNSSFFYADGSPKVDEITEWLENNSVNGVTTTDEAWIEYFTRTSQIPPEDTEWVDSEYNSLVGWPDWFADGNVPDNTENDPYVQAWIDYYEYYSKQQALPEEPVPNPATYVPEWTKNEAFFDEDGRLDEDAVRAWLEENQPPDGASNLDEVWIDYYDKLYDAQADLRLLKRMSGEEMYIDLGMGAAESAPNMPVKGTYFNSALCGIDFLGFGIDEDGDPKNLALIMRELADVFDTWGENGQMYLPEDYRNRSYEEIQAILDSKDPSVMAEAARLKAYHAEQEEKAFRLMDKLKAGQEHLTEQWVDLDAQAVYLQESESRLAIQATQLNIQFVELEEVDPAEAISMFAYQNYCYSAALKIGNQLLSQSLIDYMN